MLLGVMCSAVGEQAAEAFLLARHLANRRKVPALGSFLAVGRALLICHRPPGCSYIFPRCVFLLSLGWVSIFCFTLVLLPVSVLHSCGLFISTFLSFMSQWPTLAASQERAVPATAQHHLPFVKTGARARVGPLCTCTLILSTSRLIVKHHLETESKSPFTGKPILP